MENLGRNDDLFDPENPLAETALFLHGFSTKSPSVPINLEVKIDSRGKPHEPTTIR
jgi:hypothetical protein